MQLYPRLVKRASWKGSGTDRFTWVQPDEMYALDETCKEQLRLFKITEIVLRDPDIHEVYLIDTEYAIHHFLYKTSKRIIRGPLGPGIYFDNIQNLGKDYLQDKYANKIKDLLVCKIPVSGYNFFVSREYIAVLTLHNTDVFDLKNTEIMTLEDFLNMD